VGQKTGPLRLTAYIFETSGSICVSFGEIQYCFVLNISVNSILNNFITQVPPPSDKINNSVFHSQNQARPLHSNAHIFKMSAPVCVIFGTVQRRNILIIRIKLNFISCLRKSDVTWRKATTRYSVIMNKKRLS